MPKDLGQTMRFPETRGGSLGAATKPGFMSVGKREFGAAISGSYLAQNPEDAGGDTSFRVS
jgi:hypothetical protein